MRQPGWQVVMFTGLQQFWLSWKGPLLLLIFSLFLSANVFLLAHDPENNVLSQAKMANFILELIILSGSALALMLGANAFSGERDRQTLESLLLTPTPRGQLALGKLLVVLSLWLGMVPIAIPYIVLMTDGTGAMAEALLVLIILGTCIAGLSAGIGVICSSFAPTNIISFSVSFAVMALLTIPTQLPGSVQNLSGVNWFIVVNPVTAVAKYRTAVVLKGEAWTDSLSLWISPVVSVLLIMGVATYLLNKYLSLQGGPTPKRKSPSKSIVNTTASVAVIMLMLGGLAAPVLAQGPDETLSVEISQDSASMVAGEWIEFSTVLHNSSNETTPPLVAHLNVAAIEPGPYVDPEDWSPDRTRYVAAIQPGGSVELRWRVHALMEGEFGVFVTVISPEHSFRSVASMPLRIHAEPDQVLPMNNVVPVITIVPIIPLILVLVSLGSSWRRGTTFNHSRPSP